MLVLVFCVIRNVDIDEVRVVLILREVNQGVGQLAQEGVNQMDL